MKKILIVEDDTFMIEIYAKKLEASGFDVDAARTGEEALEKLKKENFDGVMLDISLPGISGWETLEEMRKNGKAKDTKVLILSNMEIEPEDEEKMKRLDAKKYLVKINHTVEDVVEEIKEMIA